jgi:hypothetical protein
VTVGAYLVVHAERRGDDTVIEDDQLEVEFTNGWVLFKDRGPTEGNRVAIAFPAAQVLRVERVDEPKDPADQEPAPQKE